MKAATRLTSSPLVGRDLDLAALLELVTNHPIVTLTGPGGIGKTRLALAALDALTGAFPDGATLCPLVPVTDEAAVRTTVATRLGLLLSDDDDFASALRGRRLLVLLDSCEHVLPGVRSVVGELLTAGAGLRVISTSRESLALPGERLFPVRPLEVVDGSPEEVAAGPAVRLFTDRAQALSPDFRVDGSNAREVADLCRRLDGLPLAIELAASRVRSITPTEMLTRLARGDRLDASAKAVTSERHRNLHSVVEWSYRMLDAKSRQVFDRMSVVAGGCLLEAAEAICSDDPVRAEEVLEILDGLIDRSLVFTASRDGRTRYLVLQTLASYAAEQLRIRGDSAQVAGRHADFFAQECDASWRQLHDEKDEHSIALLTADLSNIGRAVRHCVSNDADPGRGYRLTAGLWPLAFGPDAPTIADLTADVLTAWPPAGNDHPLGPDVAGVAAAASLALDRPENARYYAELAISATGPGKVPPMWGRRVLGELLAWHDGEPKQGLDAFDRALEEAQDTGRRSCVREVQHVRLLALPELARYDEALQLARGTARTHAATFEGDYARMAEVLLLARVDVGAADRQLRGLLTTLGERSSGLALLLLNLTRGSVAALQGRQAEAATAFATALELSLRRGVPRFWASQVGSVLPLLAQRRPEVARTLWGAVLAAGRQVIHLETIGLAELIDSLGAVEPRSMSSQGALELALAELDALRDQPHEPVLVAPRLDSASTLRPALPANDGARGELVREGGIWTVTWRGRSTHLPDLKGVGDLAVLLRQPSTDVPVLDLYAAVGGDRRSKTARDEVGGEEVGLGDAVDARARAAYQQRIRDLHEEVETAEAMGDTARAERSRSELDALVTHLAAAYGLGGRPRQVGDPVERARSAVAWRIRSTIRRISTADPALGRHLSASVRTGTWCRYEPPEPTEWTVTI